MLCATVVQNLQQGLQNERDTFPGRLCHFQFFSLARHLRGAYFFLETSSVPRVFKESFEKRSWGKPGL